MADKNWNRSYNENDNSALRRLQLTELENLRIFSDVCDKYNLRYYMVGGTMLGAIRHKGFIPWDDDADVGMPRPDYEMFIRIVRKELPEGYSFLNYKLNRDYKRYFSRIVNDAVTVVNASNTNTIEEKAWLDIFPFDGMPSGKLQQKLHFWHMTFIRFFYHASCFDELVNLNRPGRAWYLRAAIRFIQVTHIGSGLNTKKLMRRMERGLAKYPYDKSRYMVSFFGSYMEKEIVDKRLLGKGRKYPFETLELNGPEHYDEFLTHFYGDYMTPPKDADKDKHNIEEISYGEDKNQNSDPIKLPTKADCGEPISKEDNRRILVDMLDALADFCDSHGIYYTLSGGTLLGAIRHKGFIPWDDDIDVNMPRPDVERLYKESDGRIGKYYLIKPGDDKFTGSFYRIYDMDTVMENSLGMKNDHPTYNPVFIDIFPVEGLPDNELKRKIYYERASIIRKTMRVAQRDNVAAKTKKQLILNYIGYYPAHFIGYKRLVDKFQSFIQRYDFDNANFVGVMSAARFKTEEVIDRTGYITPIDVEFEGKIYHGPSNYDRYLSQLYDDYMELPPVEKRQTHHTFKVYWRKKDI